MAEVLSVPVQLDGYYQHKRSPSPRCHSPQPPYAGSYERSVPRSSKRESYSQFSSSPKEPPSAASTPSVATPELLNSLYSTHHTSLASSMAGISLESGPFMPEIDDSLFLPLYEYGASPSPTKDYSAGPKSQDEPESEASQEETEPEEALEPGPGPARERRTLSLPEVGDLSATVPADDTFMRHEPSRHVDYLSHDWREEDIWASWRYMVGKRKLYGNAARLENASWRTWSKSKYKLRTISPGALNWLKDCDVTWLYGPLSVGKETVSTSFSPASPMASPESKPPVSSSLKTRPILKKRSMSEIMLQRSLSTSSLLKQATASIESQKSSVGPARPPLPGRANSLASFPGSTNDASTLDANEDDYDDGREDDSLMRDDDIMMTHGVRSQRRHSEPGTSSEPQTIAMLPSTTLKYIEEPTPPSTRLLSSPAPLGDSAVPRVSPARAATPKPYVLEDDDEDLADIDWTPLGGFAAQRNSTAAPRARSWNSSMEEAADDDFELPRFAYDDQEEDEGGDGLIKRAVDAVNTARDIAHVLWNVGWRR